MTPPDPHTILRSLAAAAAGALITWASLALTQQGRVSALEAGLARIEMRLDQLLATTQKKD